MDLSNANEKEKKIHFDKISQQNTNLKRSSKCLYKRCEKYSIGSHAVSKNYYLKNISENGEVISFIPFRNSESKELIPNRVGINKATVFPGFCKEHDNIFNSIDINGITTIRDLLLQCYRSVCFWQFTLDNAGRLTHSVQEDVNDTIKSIFNKICPSFNYDVYLNEEYKKKRYDSINPIKEVKCVLENMLATPQYAININKTINLNVQDLEILYCKVDEVIPVVLNTMNTTHYGNIFHIVLPNKDYTEIIVVNSTHKEIKLFDAWKSATTNMLNIIQLIECWMIANETWYIKPSLFEQIPNERLTLIRDDIRYWQGEKKLWENMIYLFLMN